MAWYCSKQKSDFWQIAFECGGKLSATPLFVLFRLRPGADFDAKILGEIRSRLSAPKAPSPLRFAAAVHKEIA